MPHRILLGSGVYFDYENPFTSEIDIEDVAYGLGYCCRFAGQCRSPFTGKRLFYSVAEHCVRMSLAVPQEHALPALMHELGEVTCGDIPGPLKRLCPEIRAIEKRCEQAALDRFGVVLLDKKILKDFDLIMLATERRDLMAWDGTSWEFLEGVEPLPERIVPWNPDEAAERFLERYRIVSSSICNCRILLEHPSGS